MRNYNSVDPFWRLLAVVFIVYSSLTTMVVFNIGRQLYLQDDMLAKIKVINNINENSQYRTKMINEIVNIGGNK